MPERYERRCPLCYGSSRCLACYRCLDDCYGAQTGNGRPHQDFNLRSRVDCNFFTRGFAENSPLASEYCASCAPEDLKELDEKIETIEEKFEGLYGALCAAAKFSTSARPFYSRTDTKIPIKTGKNYYHYFY